MNLNNVLLIRVTSPGQHGSFELFKTFVFQRTNIFHSWLYALKTYSFLLCRTAYLLYSGCSYCVLVVLTVYYVICTCKVSHEDSAK